MNKETKQYILNVLGCLLFTVGLSIQISNKDTVFLGGVLTTIGLVIITTNIISLCKK